MPQPIEPQLAEIELVDKKKNYTVRVWLDKGFTPRFTFQNGLMDVRSLWTRILRKYPDDFPKVKGIVAARRNAITKGTLPQIHVDNVTIHGPLYDTWPRASQVALLGKSWNAAVKAEKQGKGLSDNETRIRLKEFLTQCYRRSPHDAEVDRILGLIAIQRSKDAHTLRPIATD